ncbi:MAG: hypothetical protein AAFQ20_01455, partial [Bacteroidota bacterium]
MNKGKLTLGFALIVLLGCDDEVNTFFEEPPVAINYTLDWVQTFGGSGEETAQSVIPTNDGGFAVLGYTNSTDGDLAGKSLPVNDYWLLKFSATGDLQWNKTYGGSKDDRGQSIIQTMDGGYAVVGYAMSDDGDGSLNQGFHDNWILRLDVNGDILWEKSFGFSGHDHAYDIVQTSDGGFFFSGFLDVTSSGGEGNSRKKITSYAQHGVGEFWGIKLDSEGNLLWRRYFGGTNNDRSFGTVEANDGGLVMIGASESDDFDISNAKGSYDVWVVKLSAKGDLLWEKSFGGSGIDRAYDIVKTKGGDYVIIGETFSTDGDVFKNNGESDAWLIKVSDNGDLMWERTFGGSAFDAARGLATTSDGGYVIAGNSKSVEDALAGNAGENDIWLIKTDTNGNLQHQMVMGGEGLDFGFDILQDTLGNLILVGESASTSIENISSKGMTDLVVLGLK